MQQTQSKRNPRNSVIDTIPSELPIVPFEFEPAPRASARTLLPAATAGLIWLDHGFYALEVGELTGPEGRISGLQMPVTQVTVPPGERDPCIVIVAGDGLPWFGQDGGVVVVKSPPGGGHVLVTAYGLPEQHMATPQIKVRRLDRRRLNGKELRSSSSSEALDEIPTEIVLHIERLGDRRFRGQGWIGDRGQKLRVEAFSIRPIEVLAAGDIEYKALGPNGRKTSWVSDAKVCGTRGRGLPLTGFAIRLTKYVGDEFEVIYQGAFFESGIVGPKRNGELCIPPIPDDPLEAIDVRLVRRSPR